MFATQFIPPTFVTQYVTSFTNIVKDNMVIILGLVAFTAGLGLVISLFGRTVQSASKPGEESAWGRSFKSAQAAGLSPKDSALYAERNRPGY